MHPNHKPEPIDQHLVYLPTSEAETDIGLTGQPPRLVFNIVPPHEVDYHPNYEVEVEVLSINDCAYVIMGRPNERNPYDDGIRQYIEPDAAARRLAACWNAFKGIDTEDIEHYKVTYTVVGPQLIQEFDPVSSGTFTAPHCNGC